MTVVVVLVAAVVLGRSRWDRRPRRRLDPSSPTWRSGADGRLARWLAPRLAAADVPTAPSSVTRAWLAAGAGLGGLALVTGGLALAAVALGVAAAGPVLALRAVDGRRDARLERELPALLDAVARSLRSGASLPGALQEASAGGSAAAEDLRAVLATVDRGEGLPRALADWGTRRPRPGVRLVVGALALALVVGGAPARAVDGVAATLRERAEVDREVRALATQARASAVVVTLAPLAFAALGMLGDERTATFLLRTPSGLLCLGVGLLLDGVGAWWMTRLAARVA